MGLAANQFSLLTVDHRLNTIGVKLMGHAATKLSLAREADALSLKYNDALNEKRLKWSNDAGATMHDLTYNTLMQPSELNAYEPYMITDMAGKVVVDNNYLKYAQMISPNGAPGGNYEGCRSQILGELMGLSKTDFLAEEIQSAKVNDAEAALAAHLKKEPALKQATAADALAGLGYVKNDAITASTGRAGTNHDVTNQTTWSEIVASVNTQDNYVTYLHYHKDKRKDASEMNAEFKKILTQFANYFKSGIGEFNYPAAEVDTAMQKTYDLFTKKYEYEGSAHDKDKMKRAGENAHTVNTLSHWHDEGSSGVLGIGGDSSGDAYAVSLTNMVNVFLGYLLDTENATQKLQAGNAGTYTFDLKNTTLTTPASQKEHDAWEAEKSRLEAAIGDVQEDYTKPFDAEQQKKIDFYDAIFNAIAINGWTHNEYIQDTEYMNNIMQTGMYNITKAEKGGLGWEYDESSPTTCQNVYQVSDQSEINKATAEYELEKEKLNRKESRIDVEMKKLQTEQSALNEMKESLRSEIKENTERTFDALG